MVQMAEFECSAVAVPPERSSERLAFVCLRLPRAQAEATLGFYVAALQFGELPVPGQVEGSSCESSTRRRLGLSSASKGRPLASAGLELIAEDVSPYVPQRHDLYWKIGLALHDLDAAVARLRERHSGCGVGAPEQFLDVGYLAHLKDPSGFAVELLQTTFEGSAERRAELRRAAPWCDKSPLAQASDVVMGQITTRISDKAASLRFYQEDLGMKLLAIEPVEVYGFELYFFAFTDEQPPNPQDLTAVENREWLYQRPYTTLELQLRSGASPPRRAGLDEAGLEGVVVQTAADSSLLSRLQASGKLQTLGGRSFVEDPDGLRLFLESV